MRQSQGFHSAPEGGPVQAQLCGSFGVVPVVSAQRLHNHFGFIQALAWSSGRRRLQRDMIG